MTTCQYRVEQIRLDPNDRRSRYEQIADRLNAYAADGWRVTGIELMPRPSFGPRLIPVLLEREVDRASAGAPASQGSHPVGAQAH